MLHSDRLFPADPTTRELARQIYGTTRDLPIISPHGHVDAALLASDRPIGDPATELVTGDHYLLRMLYSQGIPLGDLGVNPLDGMTGRTDRNATGIHGADHRAGPISNYPTGTRDDHIPVEGRQVWRTLAANYHLFRATPSRQWLDHTLTEVFGIEQRLDERTADAIYDELCSKLEDPSFRPRALFDRFEIEFLATTDAATDPLEAHRMIAGSGWSGRVVPTFRPDDVIDPDDPHFITNLNQLGVMTDRDTTTWSGYLQALRDRRATFITAGATATDHGHPTAATADLSAHRAEELFHRVRGDDPTTADAELFRAQMLTEMAAMSLDDGLVMQIHAGSWRRHNLTLTERFGSDKGADIPTAMDYVGGLKALLDRFGNERGLSVVVYTLDESTYSRELAPLAGHYPALRLGPPWWFHDSPEGIDRFRRMTTETAGFYNTVGFNDDARSLLTIPARHDVSRRMDASFLARLVAEHRLDLDEAFETAADLAHGLAARAFRVDG